MRRCGSATGADRRHSFSMHILLGDASIEQPNPRRKDAVSPALSAELAFVTIVCLHVMLFAFCGPRRSISCAHLSQLLLVQQPVDNILSLLFTVWTSATAGHLFAVASRASM